MGHRIPNRLSKLPILPDWLLGGLVVAVSLIIYVGNERSISAGDSTPNALLGLNWLINHSLNFENFSESYARPTADGVPWYFVDAPNGQLTSTYPIGGAIVSFPIYALIAAYLKLSAWAHGLTGMPPEMPDITAIEYAPTLQAFEKGVAATLTALSVGLFYLACRLKWNQAIALLSTFVFAFATTTWVISAQSLWQHTSNNLVLMGLLLALLKAPRVSLEQRRLLIWVSGIFSGLLICIRPTGLLYALTALIYIGVTYRREVVYFLLGLPVVLLSLGWNYYYFGLEGLISGGYSKLFNRGDSAYRLTWDYGLEAFWGLLVSPSRGLLVYSPVLVFSGWGAWRVWQRRAEADARLLLAFSGAAIALFAQYCVYFPWYASLTYGPRFLTDLLPVLGLLVGYAIAALAENTSTTPTRWRALLGAAFVIMVFWSTATQAIGAFGSIQAWEIVPTNYKTRLWDWRDTEITRTAASIVNRPQLPIIQQPDYQQGLRGELLALLNADGQPVQRPLEVQAGTTHILQARVKNSGTVMWYGYLTGLKNGIVALKVQFRDANGAISPQQKNELLFIAEQSRPQDEALAIGELKFPNQPGRYTLQLKFILRNISVTWPQPSLESRTFDVWVRPPSESDQQFTQLS